MQALAPIVPVVLIDADDIQAAAWTDALKSGYGSFYRARHVTSGLQALRGLASAVVLLDPQAGLEPTSRVIARIKAAGPSTRIIIVSTVETLHDALGALRAGADDYLVKPVSVDQLRVAIVRQREALRIAALLERPEGPVEGLCLDAFQSPAMREVCGLVRDVASTDANVLLLGESGTGKTFLARLIHRLSHRKSGHLVTVHCPSLSGGLLENELFGHRRGAYTGADQDTEGLVARADGGTLFFDEVGELPLDVQPKLLRLIQDKAFERVGDATTRRSDVRVVAATHRSLLERVAEKRFRADLYYRLNVVPITVPPLREREGDLLVIAETYLTKLAASLGVPSVALMPCAKAAMLGYPWPGNVRELENTLERALILHPGTRLGCRALGLRSVDAAAVCTCSETHARRVA